MINNIEDKVEKTLEKCISENTRKSFFLFAGAGSGKTHSLIVLLNKIRLKWGSEFKSKGKHVAVITYTNAATEEIISRLDFSPLFHVSTIHSFVWDVIKPYQTDIKHYHLLFKQEEKTDINNKIQKAKSKNKTYENNCNKLTKIESDIEKISSIKKFIYNPNGNNFDNNALSHSEVIKIAARMIKEKKLLQQIISQQYPFLLIDESQDTKKELIDAFLEIDKNYGGNNFTLGLIGDQKQRIYTDGEERITQIIPDKWETPIKRMNYRCDKRIVDLANKIGMNIDIHAEQQAREDAGEGNVRLFLIKNKDIMNKTEIEDHIVKRMRIISKDERWTMSKNNIKILTLEHMMAAHRLGFNNFFEVMRKLDKYGQTLLQGKVSIMDIFTKQAFPLINYLKTGDNLSALNLLKSHSPLLRNLPKDKAFEALSNCNKVSRNLYSMNLENTTIKEFIVFLHDTDIFVVPDLLVEAASRNLDSFDEEDNKSEIYAWTSVMNVPVIEIKRFDDYVNGRSIFDTHQGVKGLEFDRVLVIIDENESNTFLFNYNKLLGVTPLSDTDKKNIKQGRETTIERTTRLFYVVCTRARHSLAIAVYTDNPDTIKKSVIEKGWFIKDEIIEID